MNYLIQYSSYDKNGSAIRYNKKMRVKNSDNKLVAQVKLDKYLEQKFSGHHKLVVHDIIEDNEITDFFKEMFGF